jgi:hypothetical protein
MGTPNGITEKGTPTKEVLAFENSGISDIIPCSFILPEPFGLGEKGRAEFSMKRGSRNER